MEEAWLGIILLMVGGLGDGDIFALGERGCDSVKDLLRYGFAKGRGDAAAWLFVRDSYRI